jgi:CP family cyanate transporter-like MFS transporter
MENRPHPERSRRIRTESREKPSIFRLILLWLAGIDLRLTLLAVPPVLPLIHRDLALDETSVAALTGLPVLLLGLIAIPGSLLIARIGARRALIAGLLVIAAASALRGAGASTAMLFAMTFVMGAGVSVIQPALPSLASRWFSASAALAIAVYANGLLIGETLSAALTIPLVLPLVGNSWELSFVVWAVPVLITALLIAGFTPHVPRSVDHKPALWWPDWRDPKTWELGLMQGGSGTIYFGANAFIPDYLHEIGRGELVGTCLTALNAGQLPASLIILLFARRLAGRKEPLIAVGLLTFAGLAGMFTTIPSVMTLGAAIIGFAPAFVLILTLALPPLLAPPEDVHRLSAGMFTIGYTVSFALPLLGGAAWDATGIAASAFLPVTIGAFTILLMAIVLRTPGGEHAPQGSPD